MGKIEHIIKKSQEIDVTVLDMYQYAIIELYNKELLSIPRIREYLNFISRYRGMTQGYLGIDGKYQVHLRGIADQSDYQGHLILMIKRMLQGFHEKKIITLTEHGQWWKILGTFDCRSLTKKELGIMTKILKQEKRRLGLLGIKNSRQKKKYLNQIFLTSFPKLSTAFSKEFVIPD